MSSSQPDYLTSLVSYVPDLNFGFDPSALQVVNRFDSLTATNQVQQATVRSSPESLEVVSAQSDHNHKQLIQAQISTRPPLRSALKKTSVKVPADESKTSPKIGREQKVNSTPRGPVASEPSADKTKPLPARLLQRKKTVAFGRTVNVSQTVEGTSRAVRRNCLADSRLLRNKTNKMAADDVCKELKAEIEKLKEQMHEMQLKTDELIANDSERNDQCLKLTEMMKVVLDGDGIECCENKGRDEKKCRQKPKVVKRYRGKENIPPNETPYDEELSDDSAENGPDATRPEILVQTKKEVAVDSSRENLKWAIMRRKYAENEEFKRLVDEAIMKYGGDESLDIFASNQYKKGDTGRARSRQREKKSRSSPVVLSRSPVIRSTTRVTKQMTVEQIQHCENSPSRSAAALSYDSKKYLARHGIIPALSDEDDGTEECKTVRGKRSEPFSVQSDYYPGNSITYYSKRDKSIDHRQHKYEKWPDLSGKRPIEYGLQDRRYCYEEKRPSRAVLNETNYQIDDFDTDEDVNDIIEISDDSETEQQQFAASAGGAKMRTLHDRRGYRDSPRNDCRYLGNTDITRHGMKQRLNKSAWN